MDNSLHVESLLRTVFMVRYITPLREGGSLPAIVEGNDGFDYVLKFKGAGQGVRALIAELIGGEIARAAGLNVPELVFAEVDEAFGRTEPDEEIQDLLKASTGLNLGMHFLNGAFTFDPLVTTVDPLLASEIVWLDAFLMNVDRTRRNTNLLFWNKEIWLIDHGATLYFHHNDADYSKYTERPFEQIRDHVLLKQASRLEEVDARLKNLISDTKVHAITRAIPDIWLGDTSQPAMEQRKAYYDFLMYRLERSHIFLKAAEDARDALV